MTMYFFGTPFQSQLWTKNDLLDRLEWNFDRFNSMYDDVRFGNIDTGLPPYAGYATVSSNAARQLHCANKMAIPTSLEEATACFVPDIVYSLMIAPLSKLSFPYLCTQSSNFSSAQCMKRSLAQFGNNFST
jgi:hypothetical protein